jgi:hypothetical protein
MSRGVWWKSDDVDVAGYLKFGWLVTMSAEHVNPGKPAKLR